VQHPRPAATRCVRVSGDTSSVGVIEFRVPTSRGLLVQGEAEAGFGAQVSGPGNQQFQSNKRNGSWLGAARPWLGKDFGKPTVSAALSCKLLPASGPLPSTIGAHARHRPHLAKAILAWPHLGAERMAGGVRLVVIATPAVNALLRVRLDARVPSALLASGRCQRRAISNQDRQKRAIEYMPGSMPRIPCRWG
jgi:hypothetical protein